MPGSSRRYAETKVVNLVTKQLERLAPRKSQREIAAEIGYNNPNMISMIKNGDSRMPLDKVPLFAKALELDPALLFRLCLEGFWPDVNKAMNEVHIEVLTKNEHSLIKGLREQFEEQLPPISTTKIKEIAREIGP